MNTTYEEVIAAEQAKLVRVVATPTGDLGYGTDLHCTTDVAEDLAEVDPLSPTAIGEAVFRRWTTPRGQNPDDLFYGENIAGMLNKGLTPEGLRAKAGALKAEAEKDDRVAVCNVQITPSARGDTLTILGVIEPADPDRQTFSLVVVVTSGDALLQEIRGAS